jgi:hypothetical protein
MFWAIIALLPMIPIVMPDFVNRYPVIKFFTTPAWLIFVGKLLYDNFDRFYFWITRSWLWITNAEVDWLLSAELSGKSDESTLDAIIQKIITAFPGAKIWHSDNRKKIIELPLGFNIQLRNTLSGDGLGSAEQIFVLNISELVVPFRKSEDVFDKLVALIDDIVLPLINPETQKYTFKVRFGKVNPYFGLFVRKLRVPEQRLVAFRVEFDEHVGHKTERVDVSEARASLTTQSLSNILHWLLWI